MILGSTDGLSAVRAKLLPQASLGLPLVIVGALTILPVRLGSEPQWTAVPVASAFPSPIGRLGFGAAHGATFHLLEARHDPWWQNTMPEQ